MHLQNPLKQYVTVIVLTLALVLSAGVIQAAWAPPTLPPPEGNVDAPINVGINSQSKLGQLLVNTSVSNPYAVGMSVFGKVGIGTASPTAKLDVISSATDETGLHLKMANTSNNTFSLNFDRVSTNVQSSFNWQTNGVNKWNIGQDNDGTEDIKFYNWSLNRFFMKFFNSTADIGMGKNSKSLYVQYSSDAAGTLDGNVGIGTVTPTAKLEVAGQIKITGGSPGDGKVLTSDANGLATWKAPSGGGEGGLNIVLLDEPVSILDPSYFIYTYYGNNYIMPETGWGQMSTNFTTYAEDYGIFGAKELLIFAEVGQGYVRFRHPGQTNWKSMIERDPGEDYIAERLLWIPLDSQGRVRFSISSITGRGAKVYGYKNTGPVVVPPTNPKRNQIQYFTNGLSYAYDTYRSVGNTIVSAVDNNDSSSDYSGAVSNLLLLDKNKNYKVTYTYNPISGSAPQIRFVSQPNGRSEIIGLNTTAINGTNSITFKPTASRGFLEISVGINTITNFSMSGISLKEE